MLKMRKLSIVILLVFALVGCTSNEMARVYGGSESIDVPQGYKITNATWKETDIWMFLEPMEEDYKPQTKLFIEKSSFGVWEGEIIFVEHR